MIHHMIVGIGRLKSLNCIIAYVTEQFVILGLSKTLSFLNRLPILCQRIELSKLYLTLLYQPVRCALLIVQNEVLILLKLITELIPQ